MKKATATILPLFALLAISFTTPTGGPLNGTVSVDTKNSKLFWKGYKVTGSHTGNIALKSGNLEFKNGVLTGGMFVIDMASITCTDLEGEWNSKLVNHLKSEDFFNTSGFPTAKLTMTKVIPYGTGGKYKIVGDLTIKDSTHSVNFIANLSEGTGKTTATTKIVVDRTLYNVKYGSGSFFDSLGDKTIYDEFDLEVSLVTM